MSKPRSTVTLTVLTAQAERALYWADHCGMLPQEVMEEGGQTTMVIEDVAYGELPFLIKLREEGIAYDSAWNADGDYEAGTEYCRFHPDGLLQNFGVYDHTINPDLGALMALIDNPARLRNYILVHHAAVTPLPWDNQVKYGTYYQARELINA